jgi:putative transcriptional regulator
MGLIRLRVRELADEKGWTLKEVALRSSIPDSTDWGMTSIPDSNKY